MSRPNFLIAGAARSGTTALATTLAQHPQVFVTNPKEVHFFGHAGQPVTYTAPGDDISVNRHLISDPDRYYALYERAVGVPLRGEGSVSTLYLPDRAIPAIDRYAEPGVKVLAILREPAARAYSSYCYLRSKGFEDQPTFERALALEDQRRADGYHHMWHLRGMSRYRDQVPAFAETFGNRFKLLVFEEYRQDPQRHLVELCDFLGLPPPPGGFDAGREVNRGGEPRCRLLVDLMNEIRRRPAVQRLVQDVTPRRFREAVRRANLRLSEPGTVADVHTDAVCVTRLREEFADDVAVVEEVLGRPVPSWQAEQTASVR